MLLTTLIILIVFYIVYVLVGAAIFMAIERKNDTLAAYITDSTVFRHFVDNNTCVTTGEATKFAEDLISEYDNEQLRVSNDTQGSKFNNWDFDTSIFFVITVITTIGFGNVTPATTGGKVFFFFYACHGIPLTAVLLINLGERMMKPYLAFEKRKFTKKYPRMELFAKRAMTLVVTYTCFALIPTMIFMKVEGWTFLNAWYFTMVALTTVGFGDFVPGKRQGPYESLYKIVTGIWIFFGLAWLSCLFSVISNHMSDTSKAIANKIQHDRTSKDLTSINSCQEIEGDTCKKPDVVGCNNKSG